ncbi:MAG: carboxylating nicotinate-nucleotide diphosphorylase [Candidatus Neomarinimicrobiota bacterium]
MIDPQATIPTHYRQAVTDLVRRALAEDIGDGDITTLGTIPESTSGTARLVTKAEGVIAGLAVAQKIFQELDSTIIFSPQIKDGASVKIQQVIATIQGPVRAILAGERTALNILQRMSGIATRTRKLTALLARTDCRLLDTRKTAPGLRVLDKWAVAIGGGDNHRSGLYDMALIKENHIRAAGGIAAAVNSVRGYLNRNDRRDTPVEVEVKSLDELTEALALPVDRIMLDNMSPAEMSAAVVLAAGRIPLEASGNIDDTNIRLVAETGVDFISVGALTHSVTALDISLLIEQ